MTAPTPSPSPIEGPQAGTIENRLAARRNVIWRARLMSQQGTMMDVRTADISNSGVGLVGDHALVQKSVMQLALQVPLLTQPANFVVVTGRVKIVFHVLKAGQYRSGAQWIDLAEPFQILLRSWVERLLGHSVE